MDKEYANRMLDFIRYDIAFDADLLSEHYRLLGVYIGIVAAQQSVEPTLKKCPSCGADEGECFVWCPRGN